MQGSWQRSPQSSGSAAAKWSWSRWSSELDTWYGFFTGTDILYKPDDAPERPEGVVGVHDRVDHEVHDHEPPGGRGVLTERVPAVDEDSDVVIPVQEYQLLLPEHNEDRVTQLRNLTTRFYYEETILWTSS